MSVPRPHVAGTPSVPADGRWKKQTSAVDPSSARLLPCCRLTCRPAFECGT